jgi:hypothetical protein
MKAMATMLVLQKENLRVRMYPDILFTFAE